MLPLRGRNSVSSGSMGSALPTLGGIVRCCYWTEKREAVVALAVAVERPNKKKELNKRDRRSRGT